MIEKYKNKGRPSETTKLVTWVFFFSKYGKSLVTPILAMAFQILTIEEITKRGIS
jgi:hypothetical protein